mmetsp:Transcript_103835/g.175702  ORF Transcript_103835/g.175702 Transcript_103835/m.175702 type:complete len:85 (+) Transcript_103835:387-641(+)
MTAQESSSKGAVHKYSSIGLCARVVAVGCGPCFHEARVALLLPQMSRALTFAKLHHRTPSPSPQVLGIITMQKPIVATTVQPVF